MSTSTLLYEFLTPLWSGWQQVKELTDSMQQLTAELDTQVNSGRTAGEQLQKLRGEASVLQLWQQNVQAERATEIEAVKVAKQVGTLFCAEVLKALEQGEEGAGGARGGGWHLYYNDMSAIIVLRS